MINGLGVLGWGVGGIEAEAAMLGQPVSMLIPEVSVSGWRGGFPKAPPPPTWCSPSPRCCRKGVVGKFVEFFGPGLSSLALADRATIGNMSPEYGATCAIFPVDEVTLQYLRFTGRSEERVALVEAYMKEQGLFHYGRLAGADVHRHPDARSFHAWSPASRDLAVPRTGSGSRGAQRAFRDAPAQSAAYRRPPARERTAPKGPS